MSNAWTKGLKWSERWLNAILGCKLFADARSAGSHFALKGAMLLGFRWVANTFVSSHHSIGQSPIPIEHGEEL